MTVFLAACSFNGSDDPSKKGDINELNFDYSTIKTKFNKEFEIYDESGKFSVTVNLGSDFEGIVEQTFEKNIYKLNMEYPIQKAESIVESYQKSQSDDKDSEGMISMVFTKLNLDKNSIGFYIDVIQKEEFISTNGRTNWTFDQTWEAPENFWYWGKVECLYTNNSSPDIRAEWFYKSSSLSSWKADYWLFLAPYDIDVYYKPSIRKIRCKIYSNWQNYRLYFRKWETSSWVQVP